MLKKRLFIIPAVGLAMLGLQSCGGSSSTSDGENTADAAVAEVGALTYVEIEDASELQSDWSRYCALGFGRLELCLYGIRKLVSEQS